MSRKTHPLVILDNELDIISGGFSWGASNPGTFKNSDGISQNVVLGGDGNDFLDGGAGQDSILSRRAGNDT